MPVSLEYPAPHPSQVGASLWLGGCSSAFLVGVMRPRIRGSASAAATQVPIRPSRSYIHAVPTPTPSAPTCPADSMPYPLAATGSRARYSVTSAFDELQAVAPDVGGSGLAKSAIRAAGSSGVSGSPATNSTCSAQPDPARGPRRSSRSIRPDLERHGPAVAPLDRLGRRRVPRLGRPGLARPGARSGAAAAPSRGPPPTSPSTTLDVDRAQPPAVRRTRRVSTRSGASAPGGPCPTVSRVTCRSGSGESRCTPQATSPPTWWPLTISSDHGLPGLRRWHQPVAVRRERRLHGSTRRIRSAVSAAGRSGSRRSGRRGCRWR